MDLFSRHEAYWVSNTSPIWYSKGDDMNLQREIFIYNMSWLHFEYIICFKCFIIMFLLYASDEMQENILGNKLCNFYFNLLCQNASNNIFQLPFWNKNCSIHENLGKQRLIFGSVNDSSRVLHNEAQQYNRNDGQFFLFHIFVIHFLSITSIKATLFRFSVHAEHL